MAGRNARALPILDAPPSTTYQRRLARLAFLAPAIQDSILEGRQSQSLTLKGLLEWAPPLDWDDQARAFEVLGGI